MNYFDLVIGLALVVTAIGGYRNGLLQSIFRTAGYIAGGVIGVAIAAVSYTHLTLPTKRIV